ncbi:hypothetical protein D3C81_1576010 [compost metagenome]
MAGSGGSWVLDKPSARKVMLRVSESPICTCRLPGSGFQCSSRVRLRAGSHGTPAGQAAGIGRTARRNGSELTCTWWPALAVPLACGAWSGLAAAVAVKVSGGISRVPLCWAYTA